MRIEKNYGFTMIELTMVIVAASVFFGFVIIASKMINAARLANAINLSSQAEFSNDDNLVLWLETSNMGEDLEENAKIDRWLDISKNEIAFEPISNEPTLINSKSFNGAKAVYFNGSNVMRSNKTFNLDKYTAFIVAKPYNSGYRIFNGPFSISSSDMSNIGIIVIKYNGTERYIKKSNKVDFIQTTTSGITTSPSSIDIGSTNFKGEIIEIIIFDKLLSDKRITNIENYLYDKYMR